jgi:hypothetical protein
MQLPPSITSLTPVLAARITGMPHAIASLAGRFVHASARDGKMAQSMSHKTPGISGLGICLISITLSGLIRCGDPFLHVDCAIGSKLERCIELALKTGRQLRPGRVPCGDKNRVVMAA